MDDLLASDLASELEARGIHVAGVVGRVSDALAVLADGAVAVNTTVLDVQPLDGAAYSLVAPMAAKGIATVFCSAYGWSDIPAEHADVPTVGKPTDIEELLEALVRARADLVQSVVES